MSDDFLAGLRAAAAFVAKRRDAYIKAHGSYDPSTGVTEFPGDGDEYVGELEEIEEGILALRIPQPAPEPAAGHWKDACRETNGPEICDEPCARCAAQAAGPAPEPAFSFDRYINGQLMAEGVTIEKQPTLPMAMAAAAKIASRGPNGEVPVLVYTCAAPAGTPMVACPNRDPLLRTAADQERG